MRKNNLLVDRFPELAKQLCEELNVGININELTCGSNKKVWWECDKGHRWDSPLKSRSNGAGCPYCVGQKVCNDNCLATINPKLTKEWHPTLNSEFTPFDITANSGKKAWWLCEKKHEWFAEIKQRNNGVGCPFCSNKKICNDNCLANINPELTKEWNYKLNKISPYDVAPNSDKKVWWICECRHEWPASINNRANGNNCPYCFNKIAYKDNCLAILNPELSKEWNYKLNKLTPFDVMPNSNLKIWWICNNGHKWQATIYSRNNGNNCPYCSGKKVCQDNCLANINPELVKEWHFIKNTLTPFEVVSHSNKKVWWVCEYGHEWLASINNRTNGAKCPKCLKLISKPSQLWLDELNVPVEYREIKLKINNKTYRVDALYNNIVYEFNGDFWHGNPELFDADLVNPVVKKTYGELYEKTKLKEEMIKSAGYKVISIWENDWNKLKEKK